jgi:hypothetical protein
MYDFMYFLFLYVHYIYFTSYFLVLLPLSVLENKLGYKKFYNRIFFISLLVWNSPPAGNPTTTQRLEQNWHYTYAVGFRSSGCSLRMVCEKPKHVRVYIVLI